MDQSATVAPPDADLPLGDTRPALYLPYGDALRVLAIASVVLIHVASPYAMGPLDRASPGLRLLELVAGTVTRWCVPALFMLSGALLLDPNKPLTAAQFYRRRMERIAVPLAFWSAFYFAWRYGVTRSVGAGGMKKDLLTSLIQGRPQFHLWFVFAMLGLYAATPLIRSFFLPVPRADQGRLAWGCVGLSAAAGLSWAALGEMGWRIPPTPVFVAEWIPYLGYFLLGYLLRSVVLDSRRIAAASAVFVAAALVSAVGLAATRAIGQEHRGVGLFQSYVSPPIIAMSVAAFLAMAALFRGGWSRGRAARMLGDASFGAYLVHVAVLDVLLMGGWRERLGRSPSAYVGLWAATLVVSFAIAVVLMRVPLCRWMVGGASRERSHPIRQDRSAVSGP